MTRQILIGTAAGFFLIAAEWGVGLGCQRPPASSHRAHDPTQGSHSNSQVSDVPARRLQTALNDALAKGQRENVRDVLSQLLQEPRLESDVLLFTGVRLAEEEFYLEASQTFARCVRDYPDLFECRYNLGLAELALQRYSDALAAVEGARHASGQEKVALLYLRGKIEAEMGRDGDADRDLTEAFSRAPEQENYALDLGLLCIRLGNFQKSIEVFDRGARLHPNSPFLKLGLALAQYLGGHEAKSVETCRALLRQQPNSSPARVLLAFMLYMQGSFQEAAQVAAAGLNDPHAFPYLYYMHAVALLNLDSKQYDQMLRDLGRALRDIPTCTLCYLVLSKVHQNLGQLDVATSDLEKAVALDPSFADAWYRLATLWDRMGRHEDAVRARLQFNELKKEKSNRENEMLRNEILKAIGGPFPPQNTR